MKKSKLVVANWKMAPDSLVEAKKIFKSIVAEAKMAKQTEVVVCPPFVFLGPLLKLKRSQNILLGAQDFFQEAKGAFTGEVSAPMIKELGAEFVIIGHSERRALGETSEIIRKKLKLAFDNNLKPILCIGEKERDKEGSHLSFLKDQIKDSLLGLSKRDLLGFIFAYEPIWAIGRSYREAMSPTDIHETTLVIKKIVSELLGRDIASSVKILYGGSVEPENAASIIEYGNIDGFLVGHASLLPGQFSQILKFADFKNKK